MSDTQQSSNQGFSNLPIYYRRPGQLLTHVVVDSDLLQLLTSFGLWYGTPDPIHKAVRIKTSKRVLDQHGRVYQINISLNRLIWLLSLTEPDQRELLILDLGRLWKQLASMTKIRFMSNDQLDYTFRNLNGTIGPRAVAERVQRLGFDAAVDGYQVPREVVRPEPAAPAAIEEEAPPPTHRLVMEPEQATSIFESIYSKSTPADTSKPMNINEYQAEHQQDAVGDQHSDTEL